MELNRVCQHWCKSTSGDKEPLTWSYMSWEHRVDQDLQRIVAVRYVIRAGVECQPTYALSAPNGDKTCNATCSGRQGLRQERLADGALNPYKLDAWLKTVESFSIPSQTSQGARTRTYLRRNLHTGQQGQKVFVAGEAGSELGPGSCICK